MGMHVSLYVYVYVSLSHVACWASLYIPHVWRLYMCGCVGVGVGVDVHVCIHVCVRERERERELSEIILLSLSVCNP